MKRKLLSILIALASACSFASCDSQDKESDSSRNRRDDLEGDFLFEKESSYDAENDPENEPENEPDSEYESEYETGSEDTSSEAVPEPDVDEEKFFMDFINGKAAARVDDTLESFQISWSASKTPEEMGRFTFDEFAAMVRESDRDLNTSIVRYAICNSAYDYKFLTVYFEGLTSEGSNAGHKNFGEAYFIFTLIDDLVTAVHSDAGSARSYVSVYEGGKISSGGSSGLASGGGDIYCLDATKHCRFVSRDKMVYMNSLEHSSGITDSDFRQSDYKGLGNDAQLLALSTEKWYPEIPKDWEYFCYRNAETADPKDLDRLTEYLEGRGMVKADDLDEVIKNVYRSMGIDIDNIKFEKIENWMDAE